MILRLQVEGFKNLSSDDVYFGPLTAIAGPNGSGKSNLLDALQLLRNLSSGPINAAFQSIRGGERNPKDVLHGDTLALSVDFLVPPRGKSPVGLTVQATATALNYQVSFVVSTLNGLTNVELKRELLEPLAAEQARRLLESIGEPDWIQSVWVQPSEPRPFIGPGPDGTAICAFADAPSSQPLEERTVFENPRSMERTMLWFAYESHPTIILAKQALSTIQLFNLDPKVLKLKDNAVAGQALDSLGRHLPSAIYRLNTLDPNSLTRIANSVATIYREIRSVKIDVDAAQSELAVVVENLDHLKVRASALSDGTLRILAMAVILEDKFDGTVAFEEPENGIDPAKLAGLVKILRDIAVDSSMPVAADNPLRSVIFTTHSQALIEMLRPQELLWACPIWGQRVECKFVSLVGAPNSRLSWNTLLRTFDRPNLNDQDPTPLIGEQLIQLRQKAL